MTAATASATSSASASPRGTQMTIFVVAVIGLLASAGKVVSDLSAYGHAAFNTTNNGLFWGFPIVIYDYFLLTSTGLAMVATLALLYGGDAYRPLVKRTIWLALAGLAGGVAVLALELGHPLRALWAIPFSFAFASPLYWKVLAVTAYVVSLLLLLAKTLKPGWTRDTVKGNAAATLVLALAVTAIAGTVYGSQSFRPFWASGDIPVAFIFESLLGGLAFVFFFTYLAHGFNAAALPDGVRQLFAGRLPSLFALAILVHLLFVVGRLVNGSYGNYEGLQVWQHIATSPLFMFEIIVGLLVPLVLMGRRSTRTQPMLQIGSALLVMVALLISRYEYIVGGQLVPLFKGSWAPPLLDYAPSATEWMLLLVAIFLANAVNAFGERWLGVGSER